MSRNLLRTSLSMVCWLTACSVSLAADWPVCRGDLAATGYSADPLPQDLQVLWKYTIPEGGFEGISVVQQGIVYLGDNNGTVYALHLEDGSEVWKKPIKDSGFIAGGVLHDKQFTIGDFNGFVRSLDKQTGEQLWEYEMQGESYAAPYADDRRVLVTSEAGELLSLDAETGKLEWKFQIEAPLRCWPTVVSGRVLLAGCDERLHAVDVKTGKEVSGVDIDGPTGSTPAFRDGNVFFGTEQGSFYAIEADKMEVRWHHFDPKYARAVRTAAAVTSQVAVYGTQGKKFVALKVADGNELWSFPVQSNVESSPVIASDSVFLATKRGVIHRVSISGGRESWQYEAGGNFQAGFTIAEGRLLIGNTDGTLYCFGAK